MNYGGHHSDTPAENIVFGQGAERKGCYKVGVAHRGGERSSARVAYAVVVRIDGIEQRLAGVISKGEVCEGVAIFDVD